MNQKDKKKAGRAREEPESQEMNGGERRKGSGRRSDE